VTLIAVTRQKASSTRKPNRAVIRAGYCQHDAADGTALAKLPAIMRLDEAFSKSRCSVPRPKVQGAHPNVGRRWSSRDLRRGWKASQHRPPA